MKEEREPKQEQGKKKRLCPKADMNAPERPDRLGRSWLSIVTLFSSFPFPPHFPRLRPPQKCEQELGEPAKERTSERASREGHRPSEPSGYNCGRGSPSESSRGCIRPRDRGRRRKRNQKDQKTPKDHKRVRKGGDGETMRQRQHEVLAREHDVHCRKGRGNAPSREEKRNAKAHAPKGRWNLQGCIRVE